MGFKLISIDIFQTLADVSSIQTEVMQTFLGDDYTPEFGEMVWDLASEKILEYFSEHIAENKTFVTVKAIFAICYSEVFRQLDIEVRVTALLLFSIFAHVLSSCCCDPV